MFGAWDFEWILISHKTFRVEQINGSGNIWFILLATIFRIYTQNLQLSPPNFQGDFSIIRACILVIRSSTCFKFLGYMVEWLDFLGDIPSQVILVWKLVPISLYFCFCSVLLFALFWATNYVLFWDTTSRHRLRPFDEVNFTNFGAGPMILIWL